MTRPFWEWTPIRVLAYLSMLCITFPKAAVTAYLLFFQTLSFQRTFDHLQSWVQHPAGEWN